MISRDLFSKIKYIDITTTRLVENVFAGEYHSVFKGKGIEFDSVREYVPGDDIRDIDWNVTAKTGIPHTKRFIEARELTVMLLIDVSASSYFASKGRRKADVIAEISALLAFSAIKNNDRVGVLFFTDRIEKYIRPQKGKRHVLRVVREILDFHPEGKGTDINLAFKSLNEILPKRATVFVFSDFLTTQYETALKVTHKKHDVVGIVVEDPAEYQFPKLGTVEIEDVETGERLTLNSSGWGFAKRFGKKAENRRDIRTRLFDSIKMDHILIRSDISYIDPLVQFFHLRAKRASHA